MSILPFLRKCCEIILSIVSTYFMFPYVIQLLPINVQWLTLIIGYSFCTQSLIC